jgi:ribonucleoside-diphosphate reductase alpha chain
MDAFGTAVSMSLQYGVPLEVYVKKFSHTRFEPWGYTKNPDIPVAKSLVDYLFRWMGAEFIPGYREATRPGGGHAATHAGGEEAASGDDTETERKPAATTARGLADGQGKARTNGEAGASRGKHPAGTNWHSATAPALKVVVADKNAAMLERAGLKMAVDPAASPADRQSQFAKFQIDAPACDNCGSITVRNGNCYLCHNCGASMGCS